jgi:hypothetical protein
VTLDRAEHEQVAGIRHRNVRRHVVPGLDEVPRARLEPLDLGADFLALDPRPEQTGHRVQRCIASRGPLHDADLAH